jgi:hypothetical protein
MIWNEYLENVIEDKKKYVMAIYKERHQKKE